MERQCFEIDGRRVTLLDRSQGRPCGIVCVHMARDEGERVLRQLSQPVLLVCTEVDWNRELTPWPAPRVMPGSRAFGGEADRYLQTLTGRIVPAVEQTLSRPPLWRGIAGCSLAGLFAVYALYKTDLFSRAASVSGSLWYDGFDAYQQMHAPSVIPRRFWFSLGDREVQTKYARMASVETCTQATQARFAAMGAQTIFHSEPGGHFQDIPGRLARALSWLCRD